MNQISDRLRGLVQSDIRRMSRECERVGGINLGQGICDLPTIPELVEGACDAIASSKATYSKFEGIDVLRERIARKIERFNGFRVDPASEIVVTVGSTGGFAAAAMATLNAGDEVILFEPYYGYHLNTLKVLGITTKYVPLQLPDWSIDFDALRAAFTPKTRGIVVCTPSNPCGKVFTRDELEKIAELCREFGAWCYTDEIYEYIVYDGRKHLSMGSVARDVTITISGFSKTFSVTGWRIGYVAADAKIASSIGLVNDLFYVCAPTPLQWGIARALEIGDDYYRNLAADYEKKRDLLAEALTDGGFRPFVPQGAYYMLAEIPEGFANASEAAMALIEEARVASVPGPSFYASHAGDRLLRFCFAKDFAALEEACKRVREFRGARV
ncbi:MAG: pyridoxal phosphate-dependent aminotransferase [Acidobacteria bacterium]|nr:pyridoxal phosphate-dependent aminotransferase [Acidobacteriota bacterium]MBV9476575.1 pyridoxal phosphate-dependent aminotransferase [Acidobacteriota bacterium]